MYEPRERPEFSWSQSRRGTFQECPRKYYWQYYGSHNGWFDDADEVARRAYRLKQIRSFYEFLGGVIHELASRAILEVRGGGRPLSADELVAMGRDALNRGYAQSKRRKDWERRPRALTMFHDFYYAKGPSQETIDRIRDRLVVCVRNLLVSQSYREALAAPFVEVKEVEEGPHKFELEGYTIYAQPDLLYRTGDGVHHVVDWKTGQEEDLHQLQLRTYGLYVRSREALGDGPIVGRLEYLFRGTGESVPLTEDDLAEERKSILDSIQAMQRYLADPTANAAREKEAFPLREDTSDCRYCKFYELCEEEIEGTVSGPF